MMRRKSTEKMMMRCEELLRLHVDWLAGKYYGQVTKSFVEVCKRLGTLLLLRDNVFSLLLDWLQFCNTNSSCVE